MTPTETVQSLYAAFGRGDVPFILERVTPDCTWTASGPGIPATGVYIGPAGVAQFFIRISQTETVLKFEPREYFANGSDVVALGFEEVRVNATGKTASTNWAMLFRLRDGKVAQFETFFDTATYAMAHHLSS